MSERSAQVANWLRSLGVARGDRVLLLLPNEVALWETMLACMKLGAVIVPTTTLVSTDDLADRFDRGAVKHVICTASATAKFDVFPGAYTRIVVGAAAGARGLAGLRGLAAAPLVHARRADARRPIRCSCTSPRAPRPSPSWCCTATRAIRWATCRRCTGSA
jgi:acetyl-CoA synthetase